MDPPTTEIYTLSLHDALPILWIDLWPWLVGLSAVLLIPEIALRRIGPGALGRMVARIRALRHTHGGPGRSEEHTSELQSLTNLVCRLLLEKKKKNSSTMDVQI